MSEEWSWSEMGIGLWAPGDEAPEAVLELRSVTGCSLRVHSMWSNAASLGLSCGLGMGRILVRQKLQRQHSGVYSHCHVSHRHSPWWPTWGCCWNFMGSSEGRQLCYGQLKPVRALWILRGALHRACTGRSRISRLIFQGREIQGPHPGKGRIRNPRY